MEKPKQITRLWHTPDDPPQVNTRGNAQLVVIRRNDLFFNLVDELGSTRRGTGGYGSTGK
jgi:dUTPase